MPSCRNWAEFPSQRLLRLSILIVFVIATGLSIGPVMRETDQASILDGALRIAQGHPIHKANFYNYDKQYLTYAFTGLLLKLGSIREDFSRFTFDSIVLWGNSVAWLYFVGGLTALVLTSRSKKPEASVALLAVLTCPTILFSSIFLGSAIVAAAGLCILAALMRYPQGFCRTGAIFAFTFLSVGARADSTLILPFLCWINCRPASWSGLVRSKQHWIMLLAAVLSILLGRSIFTGVPLDIDRFYFDLRIFATYSLFGIGAAGAVFFTQIAVTAMAITRCKSRNRKSYYLAGLLFLLFPLLYYSLQLFSPRYPIILALVTLIFPLTFRGEVLYRAVFGRKGLKTTALLIATVAVVPIAVGIFLPVPSRPSLTLSSPSLFPTADGLWPMGCYGHFLLKLRNADESPIDHNQAIWNALKSVSFQSHDGDAIPILKTSMASYLFLAARLQGKANASTGWKTGETPPFLYVDERSLLRSSVEHSEKEDRRTETRFVLDWPNHVVSAPGHEQRILRFDLNPRSALPIKRDEEFEMRLILSEILNGNEYHLRELTSSTFKPGPSDHGKTLVLCSRGPFSIELPGPPRRIPSAPAIRENEIHSGDSLHFIEIGGAQWLTESRVKIDRPQGFPLYRAITVLPDYMRVEKL